MPNAVSTVDSSPRLSGHGGFRPGAGRKPVLKGARKRTYVVTDETLSQVATWQAAHGDCTISEAIRQMIAVAHNPAELARAFDIERKRNWRAEQKAKKAKA